ncbi:ScyD/ScyE family protein [Actinocorallia populi]|uniref:ScyD/ScyE family protein n=1 Tax=Actinocorallia populi TaxID=2079200 RepID=UPI000D097558|nr:ScyD/ScyE family protein [Actinocorallia populi]
MRKAVAVMAAGVLAAGLVPASAEAAPRVKVVAKGLDNPRGLVVGRDGTVYVAESGDAGSRCAGTGEARMCLGRTGAVTAIKNGRKKRLHTGLPSLGLRNSSASGPQDLAFDSRGRLRLLLGGMSRAELKKFGPGARRLGTVVSLPGRKVLADLAAFEAKKNPDGTPPAMDGLNSNPQSFVINRDGSMVVADGGANDVLHISRKGRVRLLALLPPQCAKLPEGFPADQAPPPGDCAEGEVPAESVPTSVVRGPDGAYYVGELTGFPFAAGSARIWRVTESGRSKVVATGFTNIIDLAFDRRGNLLVLEISHKGMMSGSTQGALIRLSKGGKKTVLLGGRLVGPTGLAVTRDGRYAYISNAGVPGQEGGGKPHRGQVLRYRL